MTDVHELEASVRDALRRVEGPGGEVDLLDRRRVGSLEVDREGRVSFEVALRTGEPAELVAAAREAVASVEGVESVHVALQAASDEGEGLGEGRDGSGERPDPGGDPGEASDGRSAAGPAAGAAAAAGGGGDAPSPRERASGRSLPVMGQGSGSAGGSGGADEGPRPTARDQESSARHPSDAPPMEGVGYVVAVSSGKGGVGKSTVATNLAATWADEGHRVGLMDADVYGPDIPTMFGVHERPRMADDEVVPLEAHGVKLMSLGFIVEEDTPAIWRGPIIQGIVRQFLEQVRWGELDYLVVDLPPGTGDAQLSLAQLVRLDGGVFVTTPQDVAVGGVLKGVKMFERLDIPVTGVVENMRGFVCPDCGTRHEIFGAGGGERMAASLDLPFLGAVPLGTAVREEGDRGLPTVLGRPSSPEAEALREVAAAARREIEARRAASDGAAGEDSGSGVGVETAAPDER